MPPVPWDTSDLLSLCYQEPSGCEKEALPISESCFRLLGSSDDLSSDSESQPTEEPALLSPKQGFRRRANTLSHVPVECQEPPQLVRGSPGVSQRKLVRYHSVSTETPHALEKEKANHFSMLAWRIPRRSQKVGQG